MQKISFPVRTGFHKSLTQKINAYFLESGKERTGDWRMHLKTVVILAWFAAAYGFLVFVADSWLTAALGVLAMASGFILVGFNIMHDGAHESYSRNWIVNRAMGWTLDLLGGSQTLWRQKHNILHHTYTNIAGLDDDLETFGLLRLSPDQPRRPWHRFQHLYAPALYSLLTLSWVVYADFQKFFSGRIGDWELPKIPTADRIGFFIGKAAYLGYTLVLPMFFHSPLVVIGAFVAVHLVTGLVISVVFQLAHTVEGNSFPKPDPASGNMEYEWAVHEVLTTADFAPRSRIVTWLCGGLNFQVEHHLAPRICHIHYPELNRLVRETCAEFGIPYNCHDTVRAAVATHFRFLRQLGTQAA